jgi:RNA polymerase sigma-70 factor (ECF subfamily)
VDPATTPLEAVDAAGATRGAIAHAAVIAAWTDHHDEIYAFLIRTTRDPEVAEDLLQEAFLRLTREVRAGRTPDNVRAWLYRVGANLAVSRGRRITTAFHGIVRLATASGADRTEDAPEVSYIQREGRAALVDALAELRPDARAALLLSSEGFSGREIAEAIGHSDSGTRTMLCRARVQVRNRLAGGEALR